MKEFSHEELNALSYELPDEVEKYKQQGDFEAAEEAIGRWLQRPVAEALKVRLRLEKRLLKGLRENFPHTKEQAIALFQDQISDFGETDLARLDEEGLAEWIFLDGEKHYIHNLVRNVMRMDATIRNRMHKEDPEAGERELLREEIHRIKREKHTSCRFRLRSSIRLKEELFYPGIHLKAHLPLPAELHQISDVKLLAHSDCRVSIDRPDSLYRAICFEDTLQQNQDFFAEYEYTVTADYHDFSREDYEEAVKRKNIWQAGLRESGQYAALEELAPYLEEQYPHIRFSPYLRALAEEITANIGNAGKTACASETQGTVRLFAADDALEKAFAIYDYITTHVKYSYMREYFLIPDIPQYCARNLRGDCGVQALLFITLCRICGIPAKWQSGLYFGGREKVGAHDWAMFYAEPYGWLYADPSLGGSAYSDGDEERRRFYFGNLDPFRMAANNAFAQPFANPKRFFPADPYDNQMGELESDVRGYGSRETVTEVKRAE
ncbi:MAG: transglutaminase-like domain-containing protein [Lachnospiraceae bacterium]|nr:transglutaminase-like domain-containing protein [Lachnospiraceae bacterium]